MVPVVVVAGTSLLLSWDVGSISMSISWWSAEEDIGRDEREDAGRGISALLFLTNDFLVSFFVLGIKRMLTFEACEKISRCVDVIQERVKLLDLVVEMCVGCGFQ